MRPIVFSTLFLVALGGACRTPDPTDSDGTWVGTITTEGDVTTVVNESGSVWGGTATLVEEASIGVEAGEDPYMLGEVRHIAATDDRIYVLDLQVPALRVYDRNGGWLRDFGRRGQGPGEFQFPTGVGIDGAGRVWVHESPFARLLVFSSQGEPLATLNVGGVRTGFTSLTVTADGRAYVFDRIRPSDPSASAATASRRVMQPYDIDGEPIYYPEFDDSAFLLAESGDLSRGAGEPFHPTGVSEFASTGTMFAGYPNAYRFNARDPAGDRTVVQRYWQPVEVLPEEAAAHRRAVTRFLRDLDPAWNWSGPEIPVTKPAYTEFVPAESGEVWVVRPGTGRQIADCDEDSFEPSEDAPCWEEERIVDVFGSDGRYLGEVDVPDEVSMQPLPFIRGNDVFARVEDEAGTIMVKRYRLVLPGEEDQ